MGSVSVFMLLVWLRGSLRSSVRVSVGCMKGQERFSLLLSQLNGCAVHPLWLYCEVAAILWWTQRTWQPRPWLKRTQQRPMELPPPPLRIYATQAGMNRSFGNILFQPDRYRDYLTRIRVRRSSSITRYVVRFILHRIRVRQTDGGVETRSDGGKVQ